MFPKGPAKSYDRRACCSEPRRRYSRKREPRSKSNVPRKVTHTHQNYITDIWKYILNNSPEKLVNIPKFLSPGALEFLYRKFHEGGKVNDAVASVINEYQQVLNFRRETSNRAQNFQSLNQQTLKKILNINFSSNRSFFLQKLAIIDKTIKYCSMDPVALNSLVLNQRIKADKKADRLLNTKRHHRRASRDELRRTRRNSMKLPKVPPPESIHPSMRTRPGSHEKCSIESNPSENEFKEKLQFFNSMNSASEVLQNETAFAVEAFSRKTRIVQKEFSEFSSNSNLTKTCNDVFVDPISSQTTHDVFSTILRTVEASFLQFKIQENVKDIQDPLRIEIDQLLSAINSKRFDEAYDKTQMMVNITENQVCKSAAENVTCKHLHDERERTLSPIRHSLIGEESIQECIQENSSQNICSHSDLSLNMQAISETAIVLNEYLQNANTAIIPTDSIYEVSETEYSIESPRKTIAKQIVNLTNTLELNYHLDRSEHGCLPQTVDPLTCEESIQQSSQTICIQNVCNYSNIHPIKIFAIVLNEFLQTENCQAASIRASDEVLAKVSSAKPSNISTKKQVCKLAPTIFAYKHGIALKHSLGETEHKWIPPSVNLHVSETAIWEHNFADSAAEICYYCLFSLEAHLILEATPQRAVFIPETECVAFDASSSSVSQSTMPLSCVCNVEKGGDEYKIPQWISKAMFETLHCVLHGPNVFGKCMDDKLNHHVEISHECSVSDSLDVLRCRVGCDATYAPSIAEGDWEFDRSNITNITLPMQREMHISSERNSSEHRRRRCKQWLIGNSVAITCFTILQQFVFSELGTGNSASIIGAMFAFLTVSFLFFVKLPKR